MDTNLAELNTTKSSWINFNKFHVDLDRVSVLCFFTSVISVKNKKQLSYLQTVVFFITMTSKNKRGGRQKMTLELPIRGQAIGCQKDKEICALCDL